MYPEPGMFAGGPRPNGRSADGQWHPEGYGCGPELRGRPGRNRLAAGLLPPSPAAAVAVARQLRRQRSIVCLRHGFYVRHVNGIQFDNIEIRADKDDFRPAFVLDDVQDADLFRIKVPHPADIPVFALHNVTDFSVDMYSGVPHAQIKTADNKTL